VQFLLGCGPPAHEHTSAEYLDEEDNPVGMKPHLPLYGLVRENITMEHGVQQTVESLERFNSGRPESKSASCDTVSSATLQVSSN
jgi:hypothetical protein